MSIETQLHSLVQAIGSDIKTLTESQQNLAVGNLFPIITKTMSYGVQLYDHTILVNSPLTVATMSLPSCTQSFVAGYGRVFNFKKVDSGTYSLCIKPSGGDLIDGQSVINITSQYDNLTIQCDGTSWNII